MDINADIVNVQTLENAARDCVPSPVTRRRLNDDAGDCAPSPNTRRRLLKLKTPKLHIKIPFLKRQHYDERGCQSAEVVSQSLPTESYMPKYFDHVDVDLCQECDEDSEYIGADHPDADNQISKPEKQEDEADSDKHQSDLDENEKDSDANNEAESKADNDSNKNEIEEGKTLEEVGTPASKKCTLKPCLKVTYHGRRRASTYPGPHDCLEASFKRCVRFSPDTIEPATRDCKYREWIEKKCLSPKSHQVNVKHEKRKCQLNQMRKVNISDYMSKNYGSSFFSPIGSYGGDMLL